MGKKVLLLVLLSLFVLPFVARGNVFIAMLFFVGVAYLLFRKEGDVSDTVAKPPSDEKPILEEISGQIQMAKTVAKNDEYVAGLDEALGIVQRYIQNESPAVSAPAVAGMQAPSVTAPVPMTEAEIIAYKEKQAEQNTNTMLYVASFLLVGAAVLFIGTALDPTSKFIGLLVIALGFYIVGMWLHGSVPKLRPAAVAFVGTGLALVPFVGLAFYNYILPDAAWSWFITSLIGLVMFMYAMITIKHQTLAYLSSAFVFSLTMSSLSVMSVPFVWYFVMIILTSALLAYLAYKKPGWLPTELHRPFEQNAQLAVPLAIVGSLLIPDRLTMNDYKIIVGVTTLYYLSGALGLSSTTRRLYWTLGRVGVIALGIIWAYDWRQSPSDLAAILMASGLLAYVYSRRYAHDAYEYGWIVYSQFAIATATIVWIPDWKSVAFGLVVLGCLSSLQLLSFKRSWYGWGLGTLVILFPYVVIYGVMNTPYEHQYVAFVMMLIAVVWLAARWLLRLSFSPVIQVAKIIYLTALTGSLMAAVMTESAGWLASMAMIAAGVVFVASFIESEALLLVVANMLLAAGVWYSLSYFNVAADWRVLLTGWITAGIWYALRWYYDADDHKRRDIMLVSTIVSLLLAGLFSAYIEETLVAACLTGCVVAGLLVYEGRLAAQSAYRELAVVIGTVSLQRLVAHSYPEAGSIFYTHWWAASLALAAWLRLRDGRRNEAKTRGLLALGMLSIPTGLAALNDPNTYQLLFLAEHIALLIGGYVTNKKLVVQWAAVGIGLALVWLLKGYTYVLLALAAFTLIGLAIWRLTKNQK